MAYRRHVWHLLSNSKDDPAHFAQRLEQASEMPQNEGPIRQIDLDVSRTFPSHPLLNEGHFGKIGIEEI